MAYVFRIHENKDNDPNGPRPVPASSVQNWSQTAYLAGDLLNNIKLGAARASMGASIPSLFARLFLFDSAFKSLSSSAVHDSIYNQLVSDCLDLLEFLYQNAENEHLVIRRWSKDEQVNLLKGSHYSEHRRLAAVIEDEALGQFNDVYLFYWKSINSETLNPEEVLIGGTSPMTLVFTSPNWRRMVKSKSLSFTRLDGSSMFGDIPVLLPDRDKEFKKMVYSIYMAFSGELYSKSRSMYGYIGTCWKNEPAPDPEISALGVAEGKNLFARKYCPITFGQGNLPVLSGGIPISYEKISLNDSGYRIRATSDRYKDYYNLDTEVPLVLNDGGIPDAPYIGKSKWNPDKCVLDAHCRTRLADRVLPGGTGVKYPFLIWSDFLESKIVKLEYPIDNEKFITASVGDSNYILPLKKEFFNFFNIEDVSNEVAIVGGKKRKLVEVTALKDRVEVVLNIPVSYNNTTIELKKVYRGDDIVNDRNYLMAFFPFYRVSDVPNLNRYSVMATGDNQIRFFKQNLSVVDCSVAERTSERKVINIHTRYHLINSSFDFVEISNQGRTLGILIPRMTEVAVGNATNTFSYAVDFGTSNTYIAYRSNPGEAPRTFEIGQGDMQVVYINSPKYDLGGSGVFSGLLPFFAREFVPKQINREAFVSYPCKTATCEKKSFEKEEPNLFGNISIGYNFYNEFTIGDLPWVYKTDLKWALEKNPGNIQYLNRVNNFCLETLWILKNKSILNKGSDSFSITLSFPETMTAPTRATIKGCWENAKTILGLNKISFGEASESIAPYNVLAPQVAGQSLLNIDIGGGTTDILIVDKDEAGQIQSTHYSSTLFAADDLWGDGLNVGFNDGLRNIFYKRIKANIEKEKEAYSHKLYSGIRSVELISHSSPDVMGYLFKHNDIFRITDQIRGDKDLYRIVFIHYAALIYHVSRLIKKLGISIPEHLSFTGMGSRYIDIISPDAKQIKSFTTILLQKYTGQTVPPTFNIHRVEESKEITAKGALLSDVIENSFRIPEDKLAEVVDYGFDTEKTLMYGEVMNARDAVIKEYYIFLDSLANKDIADFMNKRFGVTIQKDLIEKLKSFAKESYTNAVAGIADEHKSLSVKETLFFWPLKYALSKL